MRLIFLLTRLAIVPVQGTNAFFFFLLVLFFGCPDGFLRQDHEEKALSLPFEDDTLAFLADANSGFFLRPSL